MFAKNLGLVNTAFRTLVPSVPVRNATMRTTQTTEFKTFKPYEKFSRQYLKYLSEKPTEEEQRIIDHERKVQADITRVFENRYNEKNPANHLKVKINIMDQFKSQNTTNVPSPLDELTKNLAKPYVLLKQPRRQKLLVTGVRKKVPVSVKKLLPIMKAISGKHLYDALNICIHSDKKAARYLAFALHQTKREAKHKEMDEERLYVHAALTGKHKRFLRLRYHAKGTGSYMKKDTSRITIILEERPIDDMYKDMIRGKTPTMLAYMLRKSMIKNDTDYETIKRNSYILTAKGRQQRRLMFKRKVEQVQLAFKDKGLLLTKNVISQKILEEEARVFSERYKNAKQLGHATSISARQAVFAKNEEASGF